MRIVARLRARADAAYLTDYHAAARARIWNALAGTAYEESHDDNDPPGFVFSNPFPPRDMEEGERRTLLISASDEQLLAPIQTNPCGIEALISVFPVTSRTDSDEPLWG